MSFGALLRELLSKDPVTFCFETPCIGMESIYLKDLLSFTADDLLTFILTFLLAVPSGLTTSSGANNSS
jgi:hypothetical protein